jgi:hypothetical protein
VQSLNGDKRNGVSKDEDDNARVDISEGGQLNSETVATNCFTGLPKTADDGTVVFRRNEEE